MNRLFRRPASARAFTLIELLTVIAIIGILAAIIIPTVGKVRATAKQSQALSNLRQLATATLLFAADNKDYAPTGIIAQKRGISGGAFRSMLFEYVGGTNGNKAEIFSDPSYDYYQPQADGRWPEQYANNPWLSKDDTTKYPDFSLGKVRTPSQVICMIDASINISSGLNQASNVFWKPQPDGTSNPTDFVATSDVLTTTGWDGYIAYRAQGGTSAKASFLDGHVEVMKKGTIQNRHVWPGF